MKLELARLFVLAAEECDGQVEIRDSYSGRGMYGEKTAAIDFEGGMGTMLLLGAYIGHAFDSLIEKVDVEPGCSFTVEDAFEGLREMRFDSMGKSGSVAY